MNRMLRAVAIVGLVAVTGCGGDAEQESATAGDVELTIAVGTGEVPLALFGGLRVTDGEATGTGYLGGDRAAAGATLLAGHLPAVARLADGPATDVACTEQYGGPDVAQITGTIGERTIATTVNRANGCGIADWDLLQPLLPEPLWATDAAASATYGDAAHPVTLTTGKSFTVRLESNVTTGFEWQVALPADPIVELVSDTYQPPESDAGVVGAGGHQLFRFDTLTIGTGVLQFEYVQPFDAGANPADTRSIHVDVVDA